MKYDEIRMPTWKQFFTKEKIASAIAIDSLICTMTWLFFTFFKYLLFNWILNHQAISVLYINSWFCNIFRIKKNKLDSSLTRYNQIMKMMIERKQRETFFWMSTQSTFCLWFRQITLKFFEPQQQNWVSRQNLQIFLIC